MAEALKTMIGGNHYTSMGMQPIEFAMANGWDNCAFSALKYLSRFRSKNGLQDLRKALHFVQIRMDLRRYAVDCTAPAAVPMTRYIHVNGIEGPEAVALMPLEALVQGRVGYRAVTAQIDALIHQYEEEHA